MPRRQELFESTVAPSAGAARQNRDLLAANRRDKTSGATGISMLTKINTLPGTQCELALAYRNR